MEQGSGYSAAWSSAFDWGSKGPEFKSPYPDHFFALNKTQNSTVLSFFFFRAKKHEACLSRRNLQSR